MDFTLEIQIPGVLIDKTSFQSEKNKILTTVRKHCSWFAKTFPGSQPVSLSKDNIHYLSKERYVICEKTDGVRFLMYCTSGLVFLIDRREDIYVLNSLMPTLNSISVKTKNEIKTHSGTLIDGELVADRLPDGSYETRYLIYDAIKVNNTYLLHKNLLRRLKTVLVELIIPYFKVRECFPGIIKSEKENSNFLPVYLKDFYSIWDILAINDMKPKFLHFSDGFIFTPVDRSYRCGTFRQLLKWKPPELNTVDFGVDIIKEFNQDTKTFTGVVAGRLMISNNGHMQCANLWVCNNDEGWEMFVKFLQDNPSTESPVIVECYFDPNKSIDFFEELTDDQCLEFEKNKTLESRRVVRTEITNQYFDYTRPTATFKGVWIIKRIRQDKKTANDIRVMRKIIDSIESNITFSKLVHEIYSVEPTQQTSLRAICITPKYYDDHCTDIANTKKLLLENKLKIEYK